MLQSFINVPKTKTKKYQNFDSMYTNIKLEAQILRKYNDGQTKLII